MDNSLAQYQNQDLRGILSGLTVVQGTAKDSGNTYYAIQLSFINGYTKRLFLKSDESFAWQNAMQQLSTQKQVDAAF